MHKFEVDVEEIRRLVELVEKHGLAELSLEEGGVSIIIKGPAAALAQVPAHPAVAQAPEVIEIEAAEHAEEPQPEPEEEEELLKITAPLVGVFYRSSSPDAPAFIEVGDTIEVGQEIGLIEAMKVFSPIPSEISGTVVAIPAENGKLVQQGEALVLVRPAT